MPPLFVFEFSYRSDPIISVRVTSRATGISTVTTALIDTGAQRSVFGARVARRLGLELVSPAVITLHGIGGSATKGHVHEVDVLLLDESDLSLRLPLAFSEGDLTAENLIGLDVLSFFDFGVSHANRLGYFGFPSVI